MAALGRQEEWEDLPEGYPQTRTGGWLNYHDAYGEAATAPRERSGLRILNRPARRP